MRIDDLAVGDDLAGDVLREVARDREADAGALPPPSWGSVAARVGIPITRLWMSTSAPPELPGLIAALVWIIIGNVTLLSSCTASRKALTIPSVTLDRSPSGLPIAIARSPTSSFDESANVAGLRRAPETLITARSSGANEPISLAG